MLEKDLKTFINEIPKLDICDILCLGKRLNVSPNKNFSEFEDYITEMAKNFYQSSFVERKTILKLIQYLKNNPKINKGVSKESFQETVNNFSKYINQTSNSDEKIKTSSFLKNILKRRGV